MTFSSDFLVVGGGISGLLTARELALAGCKVCIVDQSDAGRESSWAGGGILLPIYPWRQAPAISELVAVSLNLYPDLSRELFEATGIDPQWRQCGLLICKNPDADAASAWCERYGMRYETPDPAMLAPFRTEARQPLWLPDVAQARNPRLLKSLQAYLQQLGVAFVENERIIKVRTPGDRVTTVETERQTMTCGQLILATGAWTVGFFERFLPQLSDRPNIFPIRGQMLLFDAQPDTLSHMVLDDDRYLIPRADGKILAGSTVEAVGFDKVTTEQARETLFTFATTLLPSLAAYPVAQHWAGLRPGTEHGIPYIGRHPQLTNLSVNAGHFRNGLVMGPASARLLADLLLDRQPNLDPAPYAVIR